MTGITLGAGDVYCPRCLGARLEFRYEGGENFLVCERCGRIPHSYGSTAEGTFTWLWDEDHPAPNPGCPECGTRNIACGNGWKLSATPGGAFFYWWCNRLACRATWWGFWTDYRLSGLMRWTIRIPVADVPWETHDE